MFGRVTSVRSRRRWLAVGVLAAPLGAALVLGCHRDGTRAGQSDPADQPAAPSPSVITLGAALGSCDDVALCARECDAGSADRCRRLATSYAFGQGTPKDEVVATSLYERACAMGDPSSCVFAGQMREYAHGVPADAGAALTLYERACDLHWLAGCYNVAIMLERGHGVAPDRRRAAALYAQACAAGAKPACERAAALAGD